MSLQKPTKVLVQGSGARGIVPFTQVDVVIGFNQANVSLDTSAVIVASTGKSLVNVSHYLRLQTGAKCLATWLEALQISARGQLAEQTVQLGCLPSTGFMVAHALWDMEARVWMDGMSFDPTLVRPPELPTRKPLPQMFHNWLGERRLSLVRWLSAPPQSWSWPLTGKPSVQDNDPQAPSEHVLHTEILDALLSAKRSRSLHRLLQMLDIPVKPSESLLQDAPETLQLEGCFHLQRHQNETPNWWLYDNAGSLVINRLAQRLRSAQRQTFLELSLHIRQTG